MDDELFDRLWSKICNELIEMGAVDEELNGGFSEEQLKQAIDKVLEIEGIVLTED